MAEFDWKKASATEWDKRSDSWHERSESMWNEGSRKEIIPFFLQYLKANNQVCDLGCGDGMGAYKLSTHAINVVGVDVSDEMLIKANRVNQTNDNQFIKGDLSELPIAEHHFDGVLAINSMEWTENPYNAMKEAVRILKPGGYGCFGILGPTAGPRNNSFPRLLGEKVICNTMMPWEFEQLMQGLPMKKVAEQGVYKKAAESLPKGGLPLPLQQALSFMWIFIFQKE